MWRTNDPSDPSELDAEATGPAPSTAAFTLLELVMTLSVLSIGMLALAMVLISSTRQTIDTRESNLLSISISNALENLRAVPFADRATTFGAGGNDTFWCTETGELTFVDPGDAPVAGTFSIYTTEDSIPASFTDMGGGYDLDEDGTIESTPTADYVLLPIRISLTSTLQGATNLVEIHYLARNTEVPE